MSTRRKPVHHRVRRTHPKERTLPLPLEIAAVIFLLIIVGGYHESQKTFTRFSPPMQTKPVPRQTTTYEIITAEASPTPEVTASVPPTGTSTPSPIAPSTITPASYLNSATQRKEIVRGDTSRKQVIFTFDAGAEQGSAEEILAVLAKHHITGTFFLTGDWVRKYPEWVRKIVAAGHEVYNHSYNHPYFTELTDAQITDQLQKMDDLLFETAGIRTRPYFRAPYGDRDTRTNDAAFAAGFQSVYWSVDSIDWRDGETTETIWNRVMPNIHNGAIVLMHVGSKPTGQILDKMFTTLEEQGYKLNSLTQGL
jgi:peptidoglycan-N-acetylglucosamine deacetylase